MSKSRGASYFTLEHQVDLINYFVWQKTPRQILQCSKTPNKLKILILSKFIEAGQHTVFEVGKGCMKEYDMRPYAFEWFTTQCDDTTVYQQLIDLPTANNILAQVFRANLDRQLNVKSYCKRFMFHYSPLYNVLKDNMDKIKDKVVVFASALRPELRYIEFANSILKKYDLSGCSEIEVTEVCKSYNTIPIRNEKKSHVSMIIRLHFYKFFDGVVFNATKSEGLVAEVLNYKWSFQYLPTAVQKQVRTLLLVCCRNRKYIAKGVDEKILKWFLYQTIFHVAWEFKEIGCIKEPKKKKRKKNKKK